MPAQELGGAVLYAAGGSGATTTTTASEATVLKAVQSLGAVIGPTALVSALLFYFGWARTQSQAQYLGLDVTLFGFSTQDYILLSTYSILVPLGEVLLGGLGILWLHRTLCALVDRGNGGALWPWAEGVAGGLAVTLFVAGLVMNSDSTPSEGVLLMTPLALTFGVGMASYTVLVRRRRRAVQAGAKGDVVSPRVAPPLSVILVAMLVAVGLVWEVANYADIKGRQLGKYMAAQLAFQPSVVVYSPKRLHIDATGVVETRFPEPESAYGFRYTGLKLLFRSNGRYFLVPDGWSIDGGTTVVLRDSENLRLEFVRTGG
jgi:hypothetical protein